MRRGPNGKTKHRDRCFETVCDDDVYILELLDMSLGVNSGLAAREGQDPLQA